MIKRYQHGHVVGFLPLRSGTRGHLKVPKCGANTIRHVLINKNGWQVCHDELLDTGLDWTALVRHPVERWLSGIAQMYNKRAAGMDPEQAIEKMVHDVHTTRQCDWLRGFAPKIFRLENIQRLWEHLGIASYAHEQKRMWNTFKLTKAQEHKVLDHYAYDYDLYLKADGRKIEVLKP